MPSIGFLSGAVKVIGAGVQVAVIKLGEEQAGQEPEEDEEEQAFHGLCAGGGSEGKVNKLILHARVEHNQEEHHDTACRGGEEKAVGLILVAAAGEELHKNNGKGEEQEEARHGTFHLALYQFASKAGEVVVGEVGNDGEVVGEHVRFSIIEEHPHKDHEAESESPANDARQFEAGIAEQAVQNHGYTGKGAPHYKVPPGAVPNTGDGEDNEDVESPAFGAATAQGKVNVVTEPKGERGVPTAPKLSDIAGGVRADKVHAQGNTQAARNAVGGKAIARKVKVYAEGKQQVVKPYYPSVVAGVVTPKGDGYIIRHDKFEEEAEDDVGDTELPICGAEGEVHTLNLGQEAVTALNGARHNCGEKAAEVHVVHKGGHGLIAQDGINAKADDLESVKGDADGDDEVPQAIPFPACDAVAQKVRILVVEERQQQEENHEAEHQPLIRERA